MKGTKMQLKLWYAKGKHDYLKVKATRDTKEGKCTRNRSVDARRVIKEHSIYKEIELR